MNSLSKLFFAFAFLCLFLISSSISAQDQIPLINSDEVIAKGIESYEKEEYKKAIEFFNQVYENDSNYLVATYEKALTLMAMEEYEEALSLTKEGLKDKTYPYRNEYFNLANTLLDELEQADEAIEILNQAIEEYPYHYLLYYNRGVSLQEKGNYVEAIKDFQKSAQLSPFHSTSHYQLGLLCAHEGLYTQALLSLNTFLLLEPKTERSFEIAGFLNDFAGGKAELEPKNFDLSTVKEKAFEKLDVIFKNEIALNKQFEIPTKIDLSLIRQNYALFQELKYYDKSDGFWMQSYVPFYLAVMEQDKFKDFSYYTLISATNDNVVKALEKNLKKIKAFPEWCYPMWQLLQSEHSIEFNGKKQKMLHHYGDDGKIFAIGNAKNGLPEGYWKFFHSTGKLAAEGMLTQDKKDGEWKYYYLNGNIKEITNFEQDVYKGEYQLFYDNGKLKEKGNAIDGKIAGKLEHYFRDGKYEGFETFKDGSRNGPAEISFQNGNPRYKLTYKDNKIDGSFLEYSKDGSLYAESENTEDKRVGLQKTYYRNGELSSELNFKDGKEDGPWRNFYKNGQISREGRTEEDKSVGKLNTYYKDGTLESVTQFDDNGKTTGVYTNYAPDGKLHFEFDYKKGEIMGYRFFDKEGEVVKEASKKNKKFMYEGIYPDGTRRTEGLYELGDAGKDGVWKYYNTYGVISEQSNFDKGVQSGTNSEYYYNGNLYYTSEFKEGKREGYFTSYYISGNKREEGSFVDGKREGLWKAYNEDGKTLENVFWYVNGVLDGKQYIYSNKGKLIETMVYEYETLVSITNYDSSENLIETIDISSSDQAYTIKNMDGSKRRLGNRKGGELYGASIWYYPDGTTSTEGNFTADQEDGVWKWYNPDGSLREEGSFDMGQKTGTWKTYHINGKLEKEANYENDQYEGYTTWYHDNGQVELKKFFKNGESTGEVEYFDPNGKLRLIKYYHPHNGKLIAYSYHDDSGKPVEPIKVNENGTAEIKSLFANGNPGIEYNIEKGYYVGNFLKYYENGQLQERTAYKDGYNQGLFEEYYENGQLKVQMNYQDRKLQGKLTRYREDGTILYEEHYMDDVREGPRKEYDQNGKLLKTLHYYDGVIIKIE